VHPPLPSPSPRPPRPLPSKVEDGARKEEEGARSKEEERARREGATVRRHCWSSRGEGGGCMFFRALASRESISKGDFQRAAAGSSSQFCPSPSLPPSPSFRPLVTAAVTPPLRTIGLEDLIAPGSCSASITTVGVNGLIDGVHVASIGVERHPHGGTTLVRSWGLEM
jgi:hypothetical protein